MTNTSRRRPPRHLLRQAASLAALGVVGLALLGDSASCTDGYDAARIDLTFTSTCPTWFAPAQGELHVSTKKSEQQPTAEITEALFHAGFREASPSMGVSERNDLCTFESFGIYAEETEVHDGYICSPIPLAPGGPTEMKCKSVSARQGHPNDPPPPARTYRDSGTSSQDAAIDSTSGASLDASHDGQVTLDASSDSSSDASSDGASDASAEDAAQGADAEAAPTPEPAPTASDGHYDTRPRDPSCTITFYPAPPPP